MYTGIIVAYNTPLASILQPPALDVAKAPVLAAVVPAYRVADHVAEVIRTIPGTVQRIVVVDDCCPARSGDVAEAVGDPRVVVLRHERNRGVGGAMKTGMAKALELGADVIVKVDGDGQMDPAELDRLVQPLLSGRAAYTKGNRFWYMKELERMPLVRRAGNLGLSFLVKAASGHWNVFDPTNGYVAIRADVLRSLDLAGLAEDYFFEIDLLVELGTRGFRVLDIPMPSRYGSEESSLSIERVLVSFPPRLLRRGLRRVLFRHFWFEFTPAASFALAALPLLAFGVGFGAHAWITSIRTDQPATAGTVMLAALPCLVGLQLFLQALNYEISGRLNSRVTPDSPADDR